MRSIVFFAALACMTPSVAVAQTGRVTKLLRETISLYDKEGAFERKVPKWKLPEGGVRVEDVANGKIGIRMGKDLVYLRNSEIMTEGVEGGCLPTEAQSRAVGKKVAASGGIGSGMSGSGQTCVPAQ